MRLRSIIPMVLVLACAPGASAQLVGVTWNGEAVAVDPVTGDGTLIGPTGFTQVNAMALSSDHVLMGEDNNIQYFFGIHPVTGVGTRLNQACLTDVRAMAFAPGSSTDLYCLQWNNKLVYVDLTVKDCSGTTVVGICNLSGIQGMAFMPNGVLFGWSVSWGLVVIDPATALTVDVNGIPDGTSDIQTLAVAPDQTLYGMYDELFVVDKTSGVATPVGGTGYTGVRGLEWYDCWADWSNYGQGRPGTLGVPSLTASADPEFGSSFLVVVGNSLGSSTIGFLFAGFDQANIPTGWGGTMLVDNIFLTQILSVPANGTFLTGSIPDDPALCDVDLYLQVFEADAGAGWPTISHSQGLKLELGY